ncbi:MAG: hypothetical protein J6P16_00950 [Eubacterium sp.]|nr:hypothetical protein [Eubacterium sp.]
MGLPAATYTLKAEVTSADNADITRSGTCKIVVENLYGKEFVEAEKLESDTARNGNAYFSPDSEGGIKSSLGIFSVTYKAEAPKKVTSSYCYARLYAVVNGKFAGYVRYVENDQEQGGDNDRVSTGNYYIGGIYANNKLEFVLRATAATRLKEVIMTLNFNGKYAAIVSDDPQASSSDDDNTSDENQNGNDGDNEDENESEINKDVKSFATLYDIRRYGFSAANSASDSSYGIHRTSAKIYTISNADERYVVEGRPDVDTYYAVSGKNCQVKFAITTGGFEPDDTRSGSELVPEKNTNITGSFTVDVTPVFPTVKVHSAKVSSFYQDGLMPVLSCNWDMNASSTNKSIIEAPVGRFVYDTTKDSEGNWDIGWVKKDPITTADSMLCSYVAVKDDDTIYYCKTDITFTEA